MKHLATSSILICLSLCFTSCEGLFNKDYNFEVYHNLPITSGETLELGFKEPNDDFRYEITLPDSSVLSASEWKKEKATFLQNGTYVLRAFGDDNVKKVININVVPREFDCTPIKNSLISDNSQIRLNFYQVIQGIVDDEYIVLAKANGTNLYFRFSTSEKPKGNRTYWTVFNTRGIASEVEIFMRSNDPFLNLFSDSKQPVHVSVQNGKTHITLCDYRFAYGTGSVSDLDLIID